MEEELTAEWQSKCDKLVAAASDKHARQLAAARDEVEEATDRAAKLEAKVRRGQGQVGSRSFEVKVRSQPSWRPR